MLMVYFTTRVRQIYEANKQFEKSM